MHKIKFKIFFISILIFFIVFLFVKFSLVNSYKEDNKNYHKILKTGDLLFQDIDCGEICDAIEKVTEGIGGANFSHVAIVSKIEGKNVYIIEALSNGVVEINLEDFLNRSFDKKNPKVISMRFKEMTDLDLNKSLEKARKLIGKPYDNIFKINNDRYYCAELIYELFKEKNIFELKPMTFKDPNTSKIMKIWKDYFADLELNVPEGELGINPGYISRNDKLKFIYAFGKPSGWRGKQ
jgi:hypothetical protein